MKKFVIIDGTGLVYRGFYALPPYLKDPSGKPTNAVYGFTNMLLNVLLERKPDYIAVAFDRKEKTHRHEAYEDYKATRVAAPDELYEQIPRVKEIVEAFGIPSLEVAGFEADDILASLAARAHDWGDVHTYILTGDMDMFQCIDDKVSILYPNQGFKEALVMTPKETQEKYGVLPAQVADYKGLCGDSSDNLPGVHGIGKKGAANLLEKYGTLEKVYENLGELSEKMREKLEAGRESAFMCRDLARLKTDMDLPQKKEDFETPEIIVANLRPVFEDLGFSRIIQRIEKEDQQQLF